MHGWKASKKARILYSIGYEAGPYFWICTITYNRAYAGVFWRVISCMVGKQARKLVFCTA